ncbi:MAG: Nif3-like dinuclear metal center hexameric protein [Planctomycetota bacterium]
MKSLTVRDICQALDAIAPQHLAEDWDQVGLQVGDYDAKATKALVCIDYTPAVLDEALDKGCDFVVAYHPPMFKPLERLISGSVYPKNSTPHVFAPWKQDLMFRTLREGLAVYSPHTALDSVRGGVNDWLCDGLGEQRSRRPFHLRHERNGTQKIVVYVPRGEAADRVREAMTQAGAGRIGAYEACSFNVDGIGTFRGDETTSPVIGKPGVYERVEETRIEMACYIGHTARVLEAIREAHPYEEPAIDVFPHAAIQPDPEVAPGPGRLACLASAITPTELDDTVKRRLQVDRVRFAYPEPFVTRNGMEGKLECVAVCVGSGGSVFEGPSAHQADAFITGEMQHHQVLDLVQRGKAVILAGHTNTERPFLPTYVEMIQATDAGRIDWAVSEADVTPWEMR